VLPVLAVTSAYENLRYKKEKKRKKRERKKGEREKRNRVNWRDCSADGQHGIDHGHSNNSCEETKPTIICKLMLTHLIMIVNHKISRTKNKSHNIMSLNISKLSLQLLLGHNIKGFSWN
jgi:hypothetical protein